MIIAKNTITIEKIEKIFDKLNEEVFCSCLKKPVFSVKKTWSEGFNITSVDKETCLTKIEKKNDVIFYSIIIPTHFLFFSLDDVIEHIAHQMLHLYCYQYNINAISRHGYYHNARFKKIAEKFHFKVCVNQNNGWGNTKLSKDVLNNIKSWNALQKKDNVKIKLQCKYICPCCRSSLTTIPNIKIRCNKCKVLYIQEKGENIKMQKDNWIVTYYNDKAIVMDEDRDLYYLEIPEEFAIIGETVEETDLTPVEELSGLDQAKINIKVYEALNEYNFFD